MASRTRRRVASDTYGAPLTTRETVCGDTPISFATSLMTGTARPTFFLARRGRGSPSVGPGTLFIALRTIVLSKPSVSAIMVALTERGCQDPSIWPLRTYRRRAGLHARQRLARITAVKTGRA